MAAPSPKPTTIPSTDDLARRIIFHLENKDINMCQTIKLWIKE